MSKPLHLLRLELKNSNCTDCEKKTMTRLLNEVLAEYEAEEELAFELANYKIPEDAYIGLPSTPGALTPVKERVLEDSDCPADLYTEEETEEWKKGEEVYESAEVIVLKDSDCLADLYTKEELKTFKQALESTEGKFEGSNE